MQDALGGIVYSPDVLRHFASGASTGSSTTASAERAANPRPRALGEHDRTTPAAAAHRLAEILRDADEVVVPGAAHMLLQEQPEATLAALRAFLARVPA